MDLALTDDDFMRLRRLIHEQAGITLAPWKRGLVRGRLARRLEELGLRTFAEYHARLVDDPSRDELTQFINAMTTNKTEFFREPHHFDYVRDTWLPARGPCRRRTDRRLRLWSAGCSTGEEPYTLAMTLLDAVDVTAGWDLRILATDIDTDVLAHAEQGVYATEQLLPVPSPLVPRYFLRGTGERSGLVRVKPEVRALVAFRHLNVLDDPWPMHGRFDAIFCRNVLIYFDRATQQRVLGRLVRQLTDGGMLFLGHSETMHGMVEGLTPVGATIYRRAGTREAPAR